MQVPKLRKKPVKLPDKKPKKGNRTRKKSRDVYLNF